MPRDQYYLPQRGLISQSDNATIENANIPRSRFQNAWSRIMSFDAGYLYPFLLDEVYPGDHLTYDITAYVRMATPLFPLYSNQRIDTFIFFCPNRLVWDNFVRQMGEQDTPSSTTAYTTPQMVSPTSGYVVGSLGDHLGLPTVGQITGGATINSSSLPFRMYHLIWNQWFRDENIQDSAHVDYDDGPDSPGDYVLQQRGKSQDYFTTCLPWPQKFTAPTVPLGGLAPVQGIAMDPTQTSAAGPYTVNQTQGSTVFDFYISGANASIKTNQAAAGGFPIIYADLSAATGVAINTFRQAFMVQALYERDARGGTRYTELLRSHFGVVNPDARLQRPEYIGGGQTPLATTPIAQTTPTGGGGLGALGGASAAAGQHRASYAAQEHGFIIGLINIRSELAYQQGIHRMWFRSTRVDYYWPAFAQLGEQAVLTREIYATGGAGDATVFGYQERYHELRTRTSEVTGIMRSTAAGTIDMWHLAQKFTAAPVLNSTFIKDTPPMARILAAGSSATGQQYLADILIRRTAVRPIPAYGTPALLGRF